ncbi:MAG TPA: sigma-70 family RNA polymerase sigma factor [Fibrobacteria bacterium]|nr:sigma-70 family RNA polymerase sigma factor [Fibrobacteria bacterium]
MDSSRLDPKSAEAEAGQARFLGIVGEMRPALHRYCARMCGSVADGEDIVQDVLVKAYAQRAELDSGTPLRPWLFRIAHNRSIDWLRDYGRRMSRPLEEGGDFPDTGTPDPESGLAREETLRLALAHFAELPPTQRGAVILKDVLEYSLEEIAVILDSSVPGIKAVLHRGRTRLRHLGSLPGSGAPEPNLSPILLRYVALFNAHDWEGVRALLADEVKLDLVSREKKTGRSQVAHYFTNYEAARDWHYIPAWLDGQEAIAVVEKPGDAAPRYFIRLGSIGAKVASIRDFRYVPYIMQDARIRFADGFPPKDVIVNGTHVPMQSE